jgi:hypothetical protein
VDAITVVNRWKDEMRMPMPGSGKKGGLRTHWVEVDPYALHKSLNVHRRHLTPKQQVEEIKRLKKVAPHKSNREIGREAGASHTHVAKVLAKGAQNGNGCQNVQPSERAAKAIAENPQASNRKIAKAAKTSAETVRQARKAAKPAKPAKPSKADRQAQKTAEQEEANRQLADWLRDVANREKIHIPMLITWLEEADIKSVIKLLRGVKK